MTKSQPTMALMNSRGNTLVMTLAAIAITSVIMTGVYQMIGSSLQLYKGIVSRYDYDDAMDELKILLKNPENCDALFKNLNVRVDKNMMNRMQPIDLLNRSLPEKNEKFTEMQFGSVQFQRAANLNVIDASGSTATAQIFLTPKVRGENVPIRPRPLFVNLALKNAGHTIDSCALRPSESENDNIQTTYSGRIGDSFKLPALPAGQYYSFSITVPGTIGGGSTGGAPTGSSQDNVPSAVTYLDNSYFFQMIAPKQGAIPLGNFGNSAPAGNASLITPRQKVITCSLNGYATGCTFAGSLPTGFSGTLRTALHKNSGLPRIDSNGSYAMGSNMNGAVYYINFTKSQMLALRNGDTIEDCQMGKCD